MKRLLLAGTLALLTTAAFAHDESSNYDLNKLKDTDYVIHVQVKVGSIVKHAVWSNSYFNDKASCSAFMDEDNMRWQVALADVMRYVQAAGGSAGFDCVSAPEARKLIHPKESL